MRTVDQIVEDLAKAREAVQTTKAREEALVAELQEIYDKAAKALKIPNKVVYRTSEPLSGLAHQQYDPSVISQAVNNR